MAGLIDILQELFANAGGTPTSAAANAAARPEPNLNRMTFGAGQVDPGLMDNQPGPLNAGGVTRGTVEAPEFRVPQGMSVDTRGALPVSDALKLQLEKAIAPGDGAPAGGLVRAPSSMPLGGPPPPPSQGNPQSSQGAITGEDVARFIRSVAMGAARVDPRAPIGSAIAQGAAGSLSNSYGERQREGQLTDARDRARRQDELRAEREGRLLDKQIADGERADRRESRRDALADTTKRLREQQLNRLTDPSLTNNNRIEIDKMRNEVKDFQKTPQEAKAEMDAYLADIEKRYGPRDRPRSSRQAAPAAESGGANQPYTIDQYKPGQVIGGYRFKGGNPSDPNNYEKAQ